MAEMDSCASTSGRLTNSAYVPMRGMVIRPKSCRPVVSVPQQSRGLQMCEPLKAAGGERSKLMGMSVSDAKRMRELPPTEPALQFTQELCRL